MSGRCIIHIGRLEQEQKLNDTNLLLINSLELILPRIHPSKGKYKCSSKLFTLSKFFCPFLCVFLLSIYTPSSLSLVGCHNVHQEILVPSGVSSSLLIMKIDFWDMKHSLDQSFSNKCGCVKQEHLINAKVTVACLKGYLPRNLKQSLWGCVCCQLLLRRQPPKLSLSESHISSYINSGMQATSVVRPQFIYWA